ncbi:hypothetical protein [uncultured Tateyamaria sp.]|uniref:hypothetical protein n=1 Tax=Tateyamaria sp. 1078 TaxID=3417464 RepID=UPI002635FAE9|nr:hypothetical protein [uncultured Tateyamaria sp.]
MNTWTSRVCAAVLTCLTLAGCEGGFGLPGTGDDDGLRSATLGLGAVTLVAPNGFCIDKRSLRARFALMARCDTLGVRADGDVPLALITATTVPGDTARPITPEDLGTRAETVLDRADRDGLTMVQVRGTPPSPELREIYWRAAGRVGNQIVGLAIYEAQDSAPLGARAPRLLEQTMQLSQAQTVASVVAAADNSATPPNN